MDAEKPDAPTNVQDADPGKGDTTHPSTTVKHAPHKYAQTRGRVQSFIHVALLAKNLSELASLTTKHDEYEEWQVNACITFNSLYIFLTLRKKERAKMCWATGL